MLSKQGYQDLKKQKLDTTISSQLRQEGLTTDDNAYLLLVLAVPYLNGAIDQIMRYRKAALRLRRQYLEAICECLHEVSCLFEDLASITAYMELHQIEHPMHELIRHARNHVRHNIRERFHKKDSWRKRQTLEYFGIPIDHRGASMTFDSKTIKIGNKVIKLAQVEDYLAWAKEIIETRYDEAIQQGAQVTSMKN